MASILNPIPRPVLVGSIVQTSAALLLIVCMFLPWFGVGGEFESEFATIASDFDASAWESLSSLDVVIFLCALTVVGVGIPLAIGQATGMGNTAVKVLSAVGAGFAALALVLVLYRVIDPPGAVGVDIGREYGVFLALLAALVAAAGAALPLLVSWGPGVKTSPATGSPPPPGQPQPPPPLPASPSPPPPQATAVAPPPTPPTPPQPAATPPANWYPDPGDPRMLRYWDGRQWTQHTAPR